MKVSDNIVIKGSFYSFDKVFVVTVGSAVATGFLVYKTAFPGVPTDSDEYEKLLLSTIGLICLTSFFYWTLTSYFYYYEFREDRLVVRNLIKPYFREMPYSTLQYVNLFGDITYSKINPWNKLEFIYQLNDSRKNFQYSSINYDQDDWKSVIIELKKRNIRIEDPNKEFFKNSKTSIDELVP